MFSGIRKIIHFVGEDGYRKLRLGCSTWVLWFFHFLLKSLEGGEVLQGKKGGEMEEVEGVRAYVENKIGVGLFLVELVTSDMAR